MIDFEGLIPHLPKFCHWLKLHGCYWICQKVLDTMEALDRSKGKAKLAKKEIESLCVSLIVVIKHG